MVCSHCCSLLLIWISEALFSLQYYLEVSSTTTVEILNAIYGLCQYNGCLYFCFCHYLYFQGNFKKSDFQKVLFTYIEVYVLKYRLASCCILFIKCYLSVIQNRSFCFPMYSTVENHRLSANFF